MEEQENNKPHDIHDRGYKMLLSFTKIFQQLIEGYVEADWKARLDYTKSQRIDKSFIIKGLEKQETDMLYRVPLLGNPDKEVFLYVLIEQQSTVDYSFAFRLLFYMADIWTDFYKNMDENLRRQKGFRWPPIFPIVLYNGSRNWTAKTSLIELVEQGEVFREFIPNFSYHLVDVSHYDEQKLKNLGNSLAGVFLLEQEKNTEEELETTLKEALEILNKEPDELLWKSIIKWVVLKLKREFPEKASEVLENLDLERNTRKEIKSMLETMPKKLFTLGEQTGRKLGRQEGRQEGIKESIIEVLKEKFQEVPEDIITSLGCIIQKQDLAFLLRKAASSNNLQEFQLFLTKK